MGATTAAATSPRELSFCCPQELSDAQREQGRLAKALAKRGKGLQGPAPQSVAEAEQQLAELDQLSDQHAEGGRGQLFARCASPSLRGALCNLPRTLALLPEQSCPPTPTCRTGSAARQVGLVQDADHHGHQQNPAVRCAARPTPPCPPPFSTAALRLMRAPAPAASQISAPSAPCTRTHRHTHINTMVHPRGLGSGHEGVVGVLAQLATVDDEPLSRIAAALLRGSLATVIVADMPCRATMVQLLEKQKLAVPDMLAVSHILPFRHARVGWTDRAALARGAARPAAARWWHRCRRQPGPPEPDSMHAAQPCTELRWSRLAGAARPAASLGSTLRRSARTRWSGRPPPAPTRRCRWRCRT